MNQMLHDAIEELIELLREINVDTLQDCFIAPLIRTIYQLCGAIIAAKDYKN